VLGVGGHIPEAFLPSLGEVELHAGEYTAEQHANESALTN